MKAVHNSIAVIALVLAFVVQAAGQITIAQSDVGNILLPGRTLVNRSDNQATTMNIGNPDGGNSWDFSGLTTSTFQVFSSVDLSTIPTVIRDNFPTATHAFRVDSVVRIDQNTSFNVRVYQFLALTSSELRNLGAMAREQIVLPPLPPLLGELRITVTPTEKVYGLPSTANTEWVTAFSNNTRVTIVGSGDLVNSTTSHNARYFVDAYGSMTLPAPHGTHQALRIRKINLYTGTNGGSSWVLSYLFLSANGTSVQVEATDTLQGNSGVINITPSKTTWNAPVVPTDVRESETIPTSFLLHQNFPNPFNPTTTIRFDVPVQGLVTLKVYNLIGQEIATLVSEVKAPGVHSVQWAAGDVPSGVYFYKMQAGSFVATKRMLLVK